MPGATRRDKRSDGHSIQSIILDQSASGALSPLGEPPPALLTRMSIWPKACCARSTSSLQPASVLTSATTASTVLPAARSSAAVSSSVAWVRPFSTTRAPSAASALAAALPKPRLEPVTIATLPFNPRSMLVLCSPEGTHCGGEADGPLREVRSALALRKLDIKWMQGATLCEEASPVATKLLIFGDF